MALQVIGSGFGRTGTRSLKEALEILGISPCHHMEEVFQNPPQVTMWREVIDGNPARLVGIYRDYGAQVD